MSSIRILWVDDEVELLKPHFLFLTEKGYDLTPCKSGQDAIELIKKEKFQAIILDENMPGLSGIETLNEIKILLPNIPILMITKNEEEELMEQAIGSKISDYLIKPVNPNQILLALKKLFQHKDLIAERTIRNYQKEFLNISTTLLSIKTIKEWQDFYMNLLYWEFELESINNKGMMEIFKTQKKEANHLFARFIESNYKNWILSNSDLPLLSNNLLRRKVFPIIKKNEKALFLLIDNLRYDQWKVISNLIEDYYQKQEETPYCSIIPGTVIPHLDLVRSFLPPRVLPDSGFAYACGECHGRPVSLRGTGLTPQDSLRRPPSCYTGGPHFISIRLPRN